MPRSVEEWIGKTANTKIPPRVVDRVRDEHPDCILCGMRILPVEKTETHHLTALIAGGENREANLRPVHVHCHKLATKEQVAEKAKVAAMRQGVRGMGQKTRAKIPTPPKPPKPTRERLPALPPRNLYREEIR